MDSDDECVDVGHAFLDLQELLLTGNDVTEQQIDSRCCTCMMGIFFWGGGVCKGKNENCVGCDYYINFYTN